MSESPDRELLRLYDVGDRSRRDGSGFLTLLDRPRVGLAGILVDPGTRQTV